MAPGSIVRCLKCLLLLGIPIPVFSIPSSDNFGVLDSDALSLLHGRSSPLEIRGVHRGRKKRYIIERQENSGKCCKDKLCLTLAGQILTENCKCEKCIKGFPAKSGLSCDEKCPDGQEDNGKGGCCPVGEKANATGDKCEKKTDEIDPDKDRKGKCPDGQVLDPKEGSLPDDPKPKCQIDDEVECKKPKLPATRPAGKELDKDYKVKCGDPPEEEKKAKCNPKTHYVDRYVISSEGKVKEECKKTKRYIDQKKERAKSEEFKKKKVDDWNNDKENRDKNDKSRRESLKWLNDKRAKMEKEREKMEKIREGNDKKRSRMGKCAPVAALLIGVSGVPKKKREEAENPYDWTTHYFDEDFIISEDFLSYWPEGVDVETIKFQDGEYGVNAEAYMKRWEEITQRTELRNAPKPCGAFKRDNDVNRRCQKRSLYESHEDTGFEIRDGANNTIVERYLAGTYEYEGPTAVMVRDPNVYVPRNPLIFLIEIAFFAARMGISLLARAAATVARASPRLAEMAKFPDRLFQVAARGAGTQRGVQGMRNAMTEIVKSPAFRRCVMEGMP